MTLASTHHELDDLGKGRYHHTQHMKPIASYRNGSLRRDLGLAATGDAAWPIAVEGVSDVRIAGRIAGNSPVVRFGHGRTFVSMSPVKANNVAVKQSGNVYTFPNAWNGADLRYTYGGHRLQEDILLRTGHPKSFAFIVQEHTGFDPLTLSFGDFRILDPVLERDGEMAVPLRWLVTQQGGKWLLTCNLPAGDWAGWVLDPTLSLQPDGTDGVDTSLSSYGADTDYSTTNVLYIRGATSLWRRALIKFDLSSIPAVATVTSAQITLTVQTPGGNANILYYAVLAANAAWTESSTWNYKTPSTVRWAGDAGGDGGNDAGCSVAGTDYNAIALGSHAVASGDADGTAKTATLANAGVQAWVGGANYGLWVAVSANISSLWHSSDSATAGYRPKLVIVYELPGGGGIFQSSIFHSAIHGGTITR